MKEELRKYLVSLEVELHQNVVRADNKRLSELLADDFFEIGVSGNTYTKDDIVNRLLHEKTVEIKSFNYNVREIVSGEVAQVTYQTKAEGLEAYRSSIWIKRNSIWQLYFHQGTRLE